MFILCFHPAAGTSKAGCCENGLASPVTYRSWPPGDRWDDPWWKMPWRFWVLWCPLLPDLWKLHPFAARSDNQTWQLNPIVMIFPLKAHLGFSSHFWPEATRLPASQPLPWSPSISCWSPCWCCLAACLPRRPCDRSGSCAGPSCRSPSSSSWDWTWAAKPQESQVWVACCEAMR